MQNSKCITLEELANAIGAQLVGKKDHQITNIADLDHAGPSDASFLSNLRYEQAMQRSKAGVVIVHPQTKLIDGRNFLLHEDPSKAFQQALELFNSKPAPLSGFTGIHPSAVIHPSAALGPEVSVGPHAVIDADAQIGSNTIISSGCYIGPQVKVGSGCLFHPHVTIREQCIIGNRVILQPGAVIGGCGFGYLTDAKGNHSKLNQIGNVVIEDDVEIGANTTIDRARFKSTIIRKGTKIDNLVQIGHNVEVGQHNILVAQTGIAGSTKTGSYVIIGGQCAINGHIEITDKVMIAARSGVSKPITKSGKYGGVPACNLAEWNKNSVHLRNIESTIDEVKQLKKELQELKEKLAAG